MSARAPQRIAALVAIGALAVVQLLAATWTLGAAARWPGLAPEHRLAIGGLGLVLLATGITLCILLVRMERAAPGETEA